MPTAWRISANGPGSLTADQIRTALRYYADYTDEVSAWIRRVEEEAERAEVQWRRERELLGR